MVSRTLVDRLYLKMMQLFVPKEHWEKLFQPEWHCQQWHEYSLWRHLALVNEAAARIFVLTGMDVMTAAYCHDIGKFLQFDLRVNTGDETFLDHDEQSVMLMNKYVQVNPMDELLVRHHDISYMHSLKEVWVDICRGNSDFLMKLIATAASDTAGKGWTDAQKIQRPQVADKFRELCNIGGLPVTFRDVVVDACLNW